jgi:hypothetical protein
MTPQFEVRFNYDFVPIVSFYGGVPVERTLKQIGGCVTEVIRRFFPILESPPLGLA